jgi:hypothetical protein
MAIPPAVGVGFGCTFRSEGRSIHPRRLESRRTIGVARNVTAALVAKTRR